MKGGIGFGAHDPRMGPKLGQSLAAGPTGLQRRLEAAREREREKVAGLRGAGGVLLQDRHLEAIKGADAARDAKAAAVECKLSERSWGEAGTKGDAADVKPAGKRAAHRPVVVGEPWVAEGVSRRTWYRRRKGEVKGG